MLDLTRLRVLHAVARHESVTVAARELGYAQPSVSHHLARLEAETGAVLVQRVGRGIRVTDAGRALAARAGEILGRVHAAEDELAAHAGLRLGRVRVAAFPSALGTFVPEAVARFAATHPGVELALVEGEPPEAMALLRSGDVEQAVVFRYEDEPADAQLPSGARVHPLVDETVHLVTPAGRPVRGRSPSLTAYADDAWIAGCTRCRRHLVRQCEQAGFTPRIAYTTDDYLAVQTMVAAGLGVTLLPELALRAYRHPRVQARRLPGLVRSVLAVTYDHPPASPAGEAVLAELARAASGRT